MESISDISFDFEENPYLQYSAKELSKLFKQEKVNNAVLKMWLGITNSETPELKKAYRMKKNEEKKQQKRVQKKQRKIQVRFDRALNNNVFSYYFTDNGAQNFIAVIKQKMIGIITDSVRKFGSVKMNITYTAKFIKDEKEVEVPIGVPGSSAKVINMADSIPEIINENYNQNREVIDDMPLAESGSVFLKFSGVKLVLTRNAAMVGNQYIDLPKWIKDKKAVLNIQNEDNLCFAWSVIAAFHHANGDSHPYRVNKYKPFVKCFRWDNLDFPMKISHIHKFEQMNGISINVFGFSKENGKESIYPLYNSKFEFEKVVDLLYIESENVNEKNEKSSHYALIRNFKKLAKTSCVSYNPSSTKSANIICKRCINFFDSKNAYEKHLTFCKVGHSQCIMPKETEKIVKFKNFGHKYRHPITIYADIETLLKPLNEKLNDTETKISYHDAIMVGMHTVYSDENSEY